MYAYLLVGISAGTLLLLGFLGDRFRFLIDLATTLSFLTAPVLAFMNHKLIHQPEVDKMYRPKPWLYLLSIGGIIFLRSEGHTSELQPRGHLVCRLLPD